MRSPQRVLLILTISCFVGTLLYVPWTLTFPGDTIATAYSFVWSPPTTGYLHDWSKVKIPIRSRSLSFENLLMEWGCLAAGIGSSYSLLPKSGKPAKPPA